MNAIEIKGLCKNFKEKQAVCGLNMTVPVGAIYGFIGENGSGKSTTEKMICGLIHPTSGSIKLFGKNHMDAEVKSQMSVLIESPGCFPNYTVWNNMLLQAANLGIKNAETEVRKVLKLLKFIFTDTIKSINEFMRVCDIKVIGRLCSDKKHAMIDGLIKKACGYRVIKGDRKSCISHAAKIMEADIAAKLSTGEVVLALISSNPEIKVEKVTEMFSGHVAKRIKLISAGDIDMCAEAVEKVLEADSVLIIERKGVSKYSEIEKVCNRVLSWNKDIIGAILLDVDEV